MIKIRSLLKEGKLTKQQKIELRNNYPTGYGQFNYKYSAKELFGKDIKSVERSLKQLMKTDVKLTVRKATTGLLTKRIQTLQIWYTDIDRSDPILIFIYPLNLFYSFYPKNIFMQALNI